MSIETTREKKSGLTRNQRAVLERLSNVDAPLFGRDFADIASVQHGRSEWAGPILTRLKERGLTAQVGPKTWKGTGFTKNSIFMLLHNRNFASIFLT